jgi:phosphatidylglycerophosphate synthase
VRKRLRGSLPKASDGPVSRFLNRPVSTRITMALSRLRVPPAVPTAVSFLVGFAAACFLAAGQGIAGGLLIHASSMLDGVDGETARLTYRTSARGALLDSLADRVIDAMIVAGLGLWSLHIHFRPKIVVLLMAIGAAWAITAMAGREKTTVLGLSPAAEGILGFLMGGRDGRLLLVAIGAIIGRPLLAVGAFSVAWIVTVALRVFLLTASLRMQSAAVPSSPSRPD